MRSSIAIISLALLTSTSTAFPIPQAQSLSQALQSSGINAANSRQNQTITTGSLEGVEGSTPGSEKEKRQAQSLSQAMQSSGISAINGRQNNTITTGSLVGIQGTTKGSDTKVKRDEDGNEVSDDEGKEAPTPFAAESSTFGSALAARLNHLQELIKRQAQSLQETLQSTGINNATKNITDSDVRLAPGSLDKGQPKGTNFKRAFFKA